METTFKARKKNDKESYVLVVLNHNYKIYRFSTPYTVNNKDWGKGYPKEINATKQLRDNLDIIKVKLDSFITNITNKENRVPTQNELNDQIKFILGKEKKDDFKSIFKYYMEQKLPNITKETQEQIDVTFNILFSYKNNVQLTDINKIFADKFRNRLIQLKYAYSTVNKHLKNLKAFLTWCYESDFTVGNLSKYFKKLKAEDKEIIALNEDEIRILEESKLNNCHSRVRDLFLFSSYTGLRFSDTQLIAKEMIVDGHIATKEVISNKHKKTKNIVGIPILTQTKELLEKYDYELPKISNQKANKYLKELFKILELDRKILNVRTNKMVPLHEAITFHPGRKSFITLALTAGINSKVVQNVAGIKKDSVFNRYVAFSSNHIEQEMQKMNKSKLKVA